MELSTLGRTAIVVFAVLGVIAVVAGILLNSCAPAPTAAYVRVAPPPAKHEVIPPRPGPAAVWMEGQWNWTGAEYAWVAGHWETKPKGNAWVPGHWAKTPHGWKHINGHWTK
jgi:hypothetical protein